MNNWAIVAKSLQGLYYCVLLGVLAALAGFFMKGGLAANLAVVAAAGIFLTQLICLVKGPAEMGGRPQLTLYVMLSVVTQLISSMYTYKITHSLSFMLSTPAAIMGGLISLLGLVTSYFSLLGLANMADGLNRSDIGAQFMTLVHMTVGAFVITFVVAKFLPILLLAGLLAVPAFAILFVFLYSRAIRALWQAALKQSEGGNAFEL